MNKLLSTLQNNPLLTLVVCMLAALLLYGNTLDYGFVLDDELVINSNDYVQQGLAGIPDIFSHSHTHGTTKVEDNGYRPVPLALYAIVPQLVGNSPGAYHILNVLLYGLFLGLFLQWLWLLRDRISPSLGLLVALLFLVHPLHTEVVANIKGMEDVLIFGACISIFHLLHRFAETGKLKQLAFALIVFAIALLTKETAVTFLALIPAYLFVISGSKRKTILQTTGAFLAVFIGVWTLRSLALGDVAETELTVLNNALVAIDGRVDQLISALWIQVRYLQLFLFPLELSSDYSFNAIPAAGIASLRGITGLVAMLGLAALAAYGVWKRKLWGFGLVFYIATLSAVSNTVILIGSTMAERFLFLPIAGLILSILLAVHEALPQKRKPWLSYACVPVLLLFMVKTVDRNKAWESTRILIETDAATQPSNTRLLSNAAKYTYQDALASRNPQVRNRLLNKARGLYHNSIDILPSNFDALYNLGLLEEAAGDAGAALAAYDSCVALAPTFAFAHNQKGVLHFNLKQFDLAEVHLAQAYEFGRTNPNIVANRGLVDFQYGRYQEAVLFYEEALLLDPNHINATSNAMKAYSRLGDAQRAQYYQSRLAALTGR